METSIQCITCLLNHTMQTLKLLNNDWQTSEKTLRKVMAKLLQLDWQLTPDVLLEELYKVIRVNTCNDDPYREIKKENNLYAQKVMDKVRGNIGSITSPYKKLEKATLLGIAGNIIDFGPTSSFDIDHTVATFLKRTIDPDEFAIFQEKVLQAKSLLYFADNAGEIIFDKCFLEMMIEVRGKAFEQVSFVVKGGPIINDATMEDALFVGIEQIPNTEIKVISNGDAHTGPHRNSNEVKEWMTKHDLVISKGIANFEGFAELRDLVFLLIAKCEHIANVFQVPQGSVILKNS